jgi:hypothetical protein
MPDMENPLKRIGAPDRNLLQRVWHISRRIHSATGSAIEGEFDK